MVKRTGVAGRGLPAQKSSRHSFPVCSSLSQFLQHSFYLSRPFPRRCATAAEVAAEEGSAVEPRGAGGARVGLEAHLAPHVLRQLLAKELRHADHLRQGGDDSSGAMVGSGDGWQGEAA